MKFFIFMAKFVANEGPERKVPEDRKHRLPEQFRQAVYAFLFIFSVIRHSP